jgi:hypothetical protein
MVMQMHLPRLAFCHVVYGRYYTRIISCLTVVVTGRYRYRKVLNGNWYYVFCILYFCFFCVDLSGCHDSYIRREERNLHIKPRITDIFPRLTTVACTKTDKTQVRGYNVVYVRVPRANPLRVQLATMVLSLHALVRNLNGKMTWPWGLIQPCYIRQHIYVLYWVQLANYSC